MNHSSLTTTRKKCMESPGHKYILVHISGSNENRMNSNCQGCLRWKDQQSQPVHHQVFEKVNHLDMLRLPEPSRNTAEIIKNLNSQLQRLRIRIIRKNICTFFYYREKEAESVAANKFTDSWEDEGFYPIIEVSSG